MCRINTFVALKADLGFVFVFYLNALFIIKIKVQMMVRFAILNPQDVQRPKELNELQLFLCLVVFVSGPLNASGRHKRPEWALLT